MSEDDSKVYGRKMTVDVSVSSKELKEALRKQNELEGENESLKSKLALAAKKIFEQKKKELNAPDSIKTVSELREWREENENSGYKPSGLDLPLSQRPKGNLPLSSSQGTGKGDSGFLSHEEMIEFLTDKKLTGKTPQEREEAEAVLNAMWAKLAKGIESGQIPKGKIFEDTECKERGESILFRALRKHNERLRKKMIEARGEK